MPLPSDRPGALATALLRGLRDGSAGFVSRLGLSLASAAAGTSALMFVLGLAEASSRRVRDEHVAIGMLVVLLAWLGVLYVVWATYSRKRHVVRTIFACVAVVVVSICLSVVFGVSMRRPEFFIAGTLFLGAAALGTVLTAAVHRAARGRAITGENGLVAVNCPACGYSMSGLDACACPECGARYTLDEIIRAQDYEALKPATRGATPASLPQASLSTPPASALVFAPLPAVGFHEPGVVVPRRVDPG